MKSRLILLSVFALLISTNLFAGGFQLNEHGARAMALGGAFTGLANDPSAVYWNGAGISQLSGTNFLIGTSLIAPSSSFRGVSPATDKYRGKNLIFFPTHFFMTHKLNDQFSLGFGFTTPFGLGTEWDENWVGKYLAVETELKTFTANPIVTYTPTESFSISAGFIYSFADVLITRKNALQPILASDAFVHLEGDDMAAFGYTAGIMFKPSKMFSIGASYHSEINYGFEGTATTTGPEQVAASLPQGPITAELTTPQNIAVGVAVNVSDRVQLSADYQYIGWSSYDKLEVVFTDPEPDVVSSSPRNYENTYIIRFGASYILNEQVTLMGGAYFDNNPVSTAYINPSLPDADRIGLSFGIKAQIYEKLAFEGSYLFIRGQELTVTDSKEEYTQGGSPFNGTYNTYANIFSLGLVFSL